MSAEFQERLGLQRQLDKMRRGKPPTAPSEGDVTTAEPAAPAEPYSHTSPDRNQKVMLELRLQSGSAKALAYSYLVSADFDPHGIRLDFTAYRVKIEGRNLRPLFDALVCQRVARVQEVEPLHAQALAGEDATVVTRIHVEERRA